jgi:hypothetical protein
MKQTISKNEKSLNILNKLVLNGLYNGSFESERFELKRNHFPNNYRLIGILNEDEKFEIISNFSDGMNLAAKFALIFGVITSIISLYKGNWIIPILLTVCGIITYTGFKLKGKKEIELLTNKFLEFYKMEYD